MTEISNTRNLVEETIRILSTGEEKIRHRLLQAYTQRFQYVLPEALPEQLRPLLLSIQSRLYKAPQYNEQSTVESALYRMRSAKAHMIAMDIVEIHLALNRQHQ